MRGPDQAAGVRARVVHVHTHSHTHTPPAFPATAHVRLLCWCVCVVVSDSALTAVGQSQPGCDLSVCLSAFSPSFCFTFFPSLPFSSPSPCPALLSCAPFSLFFCLSAHHSPPRIPPSELFLLSYFSKKKKKLDPLSFLTNVEFGGPNKGHKRQNIHKPDHV